MSGISQTATPAPIVDPQLLSEDWEDQVRALEGQRPSDLALGLAAVLHTFPEEVSRQLLRMLSHHLAALSAGARRMARLGLLIDMVLAGRLPSCEEYAEERKRRKERGEEWPTYSVLCVAYKSWEGAQNAAVRFVERGGAGRVPANYHHAKVRPMVLPLHVLDAIDKCRDWLDGEWPDELEYYAYASLVRRAAAGKREPSLPTAKPLNKLFGDFDAARAAAQRRAADRGT